MLNEGDSIKLLRKSLSKYISKIEQGDLTCLEEIGEIRAYMSVLKYDFRRIDINKARILLEYLRV